MPEKSREVPLTEIHDIFRIIVQPYLEKKCFSLIVSITKKNIYLVQHYMNTVKKSLKSYPGLY